MPGHNTDPALGWAQNSIRGVLPGSPASTTPMADAFHSRGNTMNANQNATTDTATAAVEQLPPIETKAKKPMISATAKRRIVKGALYTGIVSAVGVVGYVAYRLLTKTVEAVAETAE